MLQGYLAELKKIKLLSREEEKLLWEKEAGGDEAAHQKLISAYQPLVFKIAMGFHMAKEITMELIQEGTVGLLEAAESYDYTKGVAFSLFAMHRIRGSMCDFLAREYAQTAISLDKEAYDGYCLADRMPSLFPEPEEVAERHAVAERVTQAVERLPYKEQKVLRGIFLENKTPADLAADINVTAGHVYRLEKQGVKRIRGMLSRFINELKK